jgi:hypothetical protein
MIIVSLLAACVLTVVSGLMAGLVAFVAARVLTRRSPSGPSGSAW